MHELPRPELTPTLGERLASRIQFVGIGRLVSVAAAVTVVAAGSVWLLRAPAPPIDSSIPLATTAATVPGSPDAAAATATLPPSGSVIVVQAAGAVTSPGVYELPAGARVHELVARAGGALVGADPGALELAAPLADGQRVYVPLIGEVVQRAVGATGAPAPGPVDLNTADVEELDDLPGVGPATAAAIVAHRERSGPFVAIEGLLDVRGIGPAKLDALRDLVTV